MSANILEVGKWGATPNMQEVCVELEIHSFAKFSLPLSESSLMK